MMDEARELGLPEPEVIEVGMRLRMIVRLAEVLPAKPESEITEQVAGEVTGEVTGEVAGEVKRLLAALANGSLTRVEAQESLGLKSQANFRDRYLKPAMESDVVEMTLPERPKSRLQKYRLSDKGKIVLRQLSDPASGHAGTDGK